jgi:hypothetical protein
MRNGKAMSSIDTSDGHLLDVVDDVGKGIDRKLGTVTATCPFCGGRYAAGYLDAESRDQTKPEGEPQATIRHSAPPCPRFLLNARQFLSAANKLARDRRQLT